MKAPNRVESMQSPAYRKNNDNDSTLLNNNFNHDRIHVYKRAQSLSEGVDSQTHGHGAESQLPFPRTSSGSHIGNININSNAEDYSRYRDVYNVPSYLKNAIPSMKEDQPQTNQNEDITSTLSPPHACRDDHYRDDHVDCRSSFTSINNRQSYFSNTNSDDDDNDKLPSSFKYNRSMTSTNYNHTIYNQNNNNSLTMKHLRLRNGNSSGDSFHGDDVLNAYIDLYDNTDNTYICSQQVDSPHVQHHDFTSANSSNHNLNYTDFKDRNCGNSNYPQSEFDRNDQELELSQSGNEINYKINNQYRSNHDDLKDGYSDNENDSDDIPLQILNKPAPQNQPHNQLNTTNNNLMNNNYPEIKTSQVNNNVNNAVDKSELGPKKSVDNDDVDGEEDEIPLANLRLSSVS
jgi:hypothetical protein